jgi:fructose-bisphosphate aldolase class 1
LSITWLHFRGHATFSRVKSAASCIGKREVQAKAVTEAGIIPGIKVDTGAKDMAAHPREKITEGLDGLRERLKEYFRMGARSAKWRAVIIVGDGLPSRGCVEAMRRRWQAMPRCARKPD